MPSTLRRSAAFLAAVSAGVASMSAPPAEACGGWRDQFYAQRAAVSAYITIARPVAWCATSTASNDTLCVTAEWQGSGSEAWRADLQLAAGNVDEWKVTSSSAWRRR